MNINTIPFIKLININQEEQTLSMNLKEDVLNHLNTIHAGAQYTLAETQSGVYLQNLFPHLEGKAIPILRDSKIKYKNPAKTSISASAISKEEDIEKFKTQYEKKGRALINVDVEVKDENDKISCQASFTWFIQSL